MKDLRSKIINLTILILIIIIFMSTMVNAGVTDEGKIIRKTTTNYHTTIEIEGTFENKKEENIEKFTKATEEINGNYTDEAVINAINNLKEEYNNWALKKGAAIINFDEEGITNYYYDVHDEITQSNVNLGDDDYQDQGTITIETILDKHQTYTIKATSTNEIKSVNINLQAPIAGESVKPITGGDFILIGDVDDLSGMYGKQDNVPIATTTDKITIDSTAWVKGTYPEYGEGYDDYFFGDFEKDKYYYAMISISAQEGYTLSSDLAIKVNGEAPAEVFAVYNNDNTHFIAKIKSTQYRLGDVNRDGKVNAQDATLILKYLAKKATLTEEQKLLADTDKDGKIKASDAVRILKYVTKKISEI